jgi:hypothetical protein
VVVHHVANEMGCLIGEAHLIAHQMRLVIHRRKSVAIGVALPICYIHAWRHVALLRTEKPTFRSTLVFNVFRSSCSNSRLMEFCLRTLMETTLFVHTKRWTVDSMAASSPRLPLLMRSRRAGSISEGFSPTDGVAHNIVFCRLYCRLIVLFWPLSFVGIADVMRGTSWSFSSLALRACNSYCLLYCIQAEKPHSILIG